MRESREKSKQNTAKLRELILYVAENWVKAKFCGSTKLNKVLFAIDFDAFFELGESVTNATYKKGKFGPRVHLLLSVIGDMIRSGELDSVPEVVHGFDQERLIPQRTANTEVFSPRELKIINAWIKKFRPLTAATVRDWSHKFAGWKLLEDKEDIPYHSIYWGPSLQEPVTEEDIQNVRKRLAKGKPISAGRGIW